MLSVLRITRKKKNQTNVPKKKKLETRWVKNMKKKDYPVKVMVPKYLERKTTLLYKHDFPDVSS